MNYEELFKQIQKKKSFLCVGLDTDITKIPDFLRTKKESSFDFNQEIIDATAQYAVAYKPNLAFYEVLGMAGWLQLEMTIKYLKEKYPEILIIADAKRGDIGNTSKMYAQAFFKKLGADAITIAPYMGKDSVQPFLEYEDKWSIILNLTSNEGSIDLQTCHIKENELLVHEHMLKKATEEWGATPDKAMFVVGATKAESLKAIRQIVPDHFLLIPGVGAQGGSLEEVATYGLNKSCGLLVNNSRQIIYASKDRDFAQAAAREAQKMQLAMEKILVDAELIKAPEF